MSHTGYGHPDYPAYQHSERRSLGGLVVALTVLLAILALLCLLNAGAYFYRAGQFEDAAEGTFVPDEEANAADAAVFGTGGFLQLLYIATGIVFIIWQFRHAKNAQILGATGGLGPGWAIGGWFIPLANLVLPPLQLHHSSRVSRTRIGSQRSLSALIVPWAITFYGGGVLSGVALAMWPEFLETTADFEAAADSDVVDGVSSMLWLLAAFLGIAMVRSMSKRQDQAFDTWLAQPQGQPWPPQPGAMPWTHEPQQPWTGSQPQHPTGQVSPSPWSKPASPGSDTDPWRSPS